MAGAAKTGHAGVDDAGRKRSEVDLDHPRYYLNRELTWLAFNERVLHEAQDARNPLLERLFFLAVVGSNLDEFYMKRIGGLKQQQGAGVTRLTADGRTPRQQILEFNQVVRELVRRQERLEAELLELLAAEGIRVVAYNELSREQQKRADRHFRANIYPLLTPQGMDPAHPFPFISNLSVNLLVATSYPGSSHSYLNRIKVPVGLGTPRFVRIDAEQHLYVLVEDIIANNLEILFPGMVIESCELFRVTRNAITEKSEEQANDLLALIESALRDRKFAEIVRLEVGRCMGEAHRGMLAAELGIDQEEDVFEVEGIMAKRDLFQLVAIDRPDLHYPVHQPVDNAELLPEHPNVFHVIRDEKAILLQHPYESFDSTVERFLREASQDPKVLAIKMTLYRTSKKSRIIQHLIDAAQNGKQVAVVVELKARFDESANIRWAEYLEQAGIHVTYGVVGLKTHSKVIFVVRRDYDGLRRYAHIGTGNYHAGTARLYSDLGLFTNDEAIGQDATELFNYLTTGYNPQRDYKKLLPAPKMLKEALLAKIERERKLHSAKRPGLIQFKMNALEDADITRALYEASRDGVRIDLIVRDTCRFRPGLAGLSESARVLSIVGRFLEHARIYYFQNGGDEEYFIGSADCMMRNLESRVEVVAPVESPRLRRLLREHLDAQLNDHRNAWEMRSDGSYVQRQPRNEAEEIGSQQWLILQAERRLKEADKELKRLGKGKRRRSGRNLR